VQDGFEGQLGILDGLVSRPATQVRMDHLAGDGPGRMMLTSITMS
jgi:hypothetical protein